MKKTTEDSANDINDIINMIDGKINDGVGRLKVFIDDSQAAGTVKEQYHHGRCDVGSPWAKGTVSNCDITDGDR